jgi:8-oxo-dGTP pyrophosphatase MutT (NUDIX family)
VRKVMSCGVLVFREEPVRSFLLLRQSHRYDLPKGHVEAGETEMTCALRELVEETGIESSRVRIEENFRYATTYYPRYRRLGNEQVEKTVVIYLGWLLEDRPILVSEHVGHEWIEWKPPHKIERGTIDGLLSEVDKFLRGQ